MINKLSIISLVVNFVLVLGICGYLIRSKVDISKPDSHGQGHNNSNKTHKVDEENKKSMNIDHSGQHSDFTIPENATNKPAILLKTYPDTKSGYNLHLVTTNFEFAPQKVNTQGSSYNEGHAHLTINQKKISRVYSNWVHIPADLLTQDKNEVIVSLNNNNHQGFHFQEKHIEAKALLLKSIQSNNNSIPMSQFATKITDDKDIIMLDVRTPVEFADGHIPGAINIDLQNPNFESEISKLDKQKKYAVYCKSGNRSKMAHDKMMTLGFANLINAQDGFETWKYLGLPIEK